MINELRDKSLVQNIQTNKKTPNRFHTSASKHKLTTASKIYQFNFGKMRHLFHKNCLFLSRRSQKPHPGKKQNFQKSYKKSDVIRENVKQF